MLNIEVIVLNGAPGSGKSTVADALSDALRNRHITHAIIDVDELSRTYPEEQGDLMWDNLAAVWQNYSRIPNVKVILPICIDDQVALRKLKAAVPCDRLTICELTAPMVLLEARVSEREPNEYWRKKLRRLVKAYFNRSETFADFQISTELLHPAQAADEVIDKLNWASG